LLGMERVLEPAQRTDALPEGGPPARLVPGPESAGVGGVDVAQVELRAVRDPVPLQQPTCALEQPVAHATPSRIPCAPPAVSGRAAACSRSPRCPSARA